MHEVCLCVCGGGGVTHGWPTLKSCLHPKALPPITVSFVWMCVCTCKCVCMQTCMCNNALGFTHGWPTLKSRHYLKAIPSITVSFVWMCACTCKCVHANVYTCIWMCLCTCKCVCMQTCMHVPFCKWSVVLCLHLTSKDSGSASIICTRTHTLSHISVIQEWKTGRRRKQRKIQTSAHIRHKHRRKCTTYTRW